MSKVVIQGNASGTGDFTIAAPNSNTNRTLTLPDEAGTVLTSASSLAAANLSGSVASSAMPAGSVLQVVNGSTSTAVTSTATALWVDTGITATISPTSATSKIMVIINICGMHRSSSSSWNRAGIRILRGATTLGIQALAQSWPNTALEFRSAGAMYSQYDSPATTSATTYKVQFQAEALSGTTSISVQRDGNSGVSQIFLMEIAV
jgi:hypothetical protein